MKRTSSRPSPMKACGSYLEWKKDQSSKNQKLIGSLERLVKATAPKLTKTVKWGQGCFMAGEVWKIYIHSAADHVQLGFYYGSKLKDPDNLLEGKGKYVRCVKVRTPKDINAPAFKKLILQAIK